MSTALSTPTHRGEHLGASAASHPELTVWQRLCYAGGVFGGNLTDMAVVTWAMYFYAPPAGHGQALAPITWVAAAMVLARFVDALTHLAVGFWSDRSHNPRGRRIPFLAASAVPMALAFILLWFPPFGHSTPLNGLYATFFIGLFYFFFASYFCPHGALLPEITSDSGERVSISILTAVFGMLSAALIGIGSGLLVDHFGFRVTGLVLGLLAAPFLCAPVAVIREKPRGEADEITFSFREAVIQTIHNRPFMIFAISSVFALLAQNTVVGALPYFVAVVLGGSESQMGFLMGGSLVVALASFPLMTRLAAKWGKGRVLEVSMLAGAVILASLFLVGRLDLPIPPLHQTIILIGLSGLSFAPLMVLPTAILADAIDYEFETSGKRRSAMYLGFQGILQKATMAFAPLVVSTLFTVFGYSAERPLGVRLVGPVTALLLLGAWWVFRGYPLKDR